ncbi:hypothetical protein R3P38DRAFT_3279950 [Favolaschia claudopus]|uniref:Uncharacterized protein n=1 Tax=Favolaschia claudopus TaxID=2862362 RepID=A0AAW0AHL2_9AGAR
MQDNGGGSGRVSPEPRRTLHKPGKGGADSGNAPRRPADPFNVEGPKYATSKAKPFPNVIRNAEVNSPHFDAKLAATSAICYHPVSKHPDSIVHPPRRPTTTNSSYTSSTVPPRHPLHVTHCRVSPRHEACPVHLYSWFAKSVTCDEPAPTSISLSIHPSPTPEPRRTGPACPKFEASG